jgi:hypothetical protein
MAFFKVVCTGCGVADQRMAETAAAAVEALCSCGAAVKRRPTGPGAQKIEVLDNGLMARAIERPADAERLYKERHDNADPLAGLSLKPMND